MKNNTDIKWYSNWSTVIDQNRIYQFRKKNYKKDIQYIAVHFNFPSQVP
ncbi:hypothetical protein [Flavobacterium reichenbachii]|nr:hypothetical protein [Flavobacterium reichenbachii]